MLGSSRSLPKPVHLPQPPADVVRDVNGRSRRDHQTAVIIDTGGVNNGGIVRINDDQSVQDQGTLACCDSVVPANYGARFNSPGFWTPSLVRCIVEMNQSFGTGQSVAAIAFSVAEHICE